ncbi:MAG: hypothetical protein H7835_04445 [Magnetococcus sp. XQGC-1]
MGDGSEVEERLLALVTEKLRELLRSPVQTWAPELIAKRLQEELERIKGGGLLSRRQYRGGEAEPVPGFDALLRETFLPHIHAMARQIAQEEVARALPDLAEQRILAELERL